MTVEEMSRRMTVRELDEWLAYFQCIEVMPDPARDAARICQVIAQVNGDKDAKLETFLFKPPLAERKAQTPQHMMAILGKTEG
jgi:hypothetical protein